jgi:xylan 1,4-beta-xylosidase
VRLELAGAKAPRAVWLERIDEHHANPKAAWQALGQPEYPDQAALAQIESASRMTREPHPWTADEQGVRLDLDLPPHAVAALTLEFGGRNR